MRRPPPASCGRRAARPDWRAPGPACRARADRPELWPGPGEDLCHLAGDWRILQLLRGHRWSLDDLVTAWFAADTAPDAPPRRFADLGCGIGAVLLLLAWRFPDARGVGVEAQDVSVGLARRSLAWNGADRRCEVRHGDLRDPRTLPEGAVFDLVTGTPPYLPIGSAHASHARPVGRVPPRAARRHRGLLRRGGAPARAGRLVRHLRGRRAARPRRTRRRARGPRRGATTRRRARAPASSALRGLGLRARGVDAVPRSRSRSSCATRAGHWTAAFRAVRGAMGMPA